jgi:hypothetical protein
VFIRGYPPRPQLRRSDILVEPAPINNTPAPEERHLPASPPPPTFPINHQRAVSTLNSSDHPSAARQPKNKTTMQKPFTSCLRRTKRAVKDGKGFVQERSAAEPESGTRRFCICRFFPVAAGDIPLDPSSRALPPRVRSSDSTLGCTLTMRPHFISAFAGVALLLVGCASPPTVIAPRPLAADLPVFYDRANLAEVYGRCPRCQAWNKGYYMHWDGTDVAGSGYFGTCAKCNVCLVSDAPFLMAEPRIVKWKIE